MAAGWNYISLPVDADIEFVDVFYKYNGTNYTYAEATTNANETGARLAEPTIFTWDYNGQSWDPAGTCFKPYCGNIQYWWKTAGTGIGDTLALYYPYTTKKN